MSVVDQPASSSACSAAGVGVARMKDEQVHVLEGRGEARTEDTAGVGVHAIGWPGRILATQRTRRIAAIGAVRPGIRDGGVNAPSAAARRLRAAARPSA